MKHKYKPQQSNAKLVQEPLPSTTDFDDSKRRWPSKVAMSGSAGPTAEDMDGEDLIEDDYDSYDEIFTQHFTASHPR
jgi:cell cycle checkpoint protein